MTNIWIIYEKNKYTTSKIIIKNKEEEGSIIRSFVFTMTLITKKSTLSSQTRWTKVSKSNNHNSNISTVYKYLNVLTFINSFQIIRFKAISFRSDRLSHSRWITYRVKQK